jgi:hypothetical protein
MRITTTMDFRGLLLTVLKEAALRLIQIVSETLFKLSDFYYTFNLDNKLATPHENCTSWFSFELDRTRSKLGLLEEELVQARNDSCGKPDWKEQPTNNHQETVPIYIYIVHTEPQPLRRVYPGELTLLATSKPNVIVFPRNSRYSSKDTFAVGLYRLHLQHS